MNPAVLPNPLELISGDEFSLAFRMTNRSRELMAWTGYSVKCEFWSRAGFGQPTAKLSEYFGLLDAATGMVTLVIAPAATSAMTWGKATAVWVLTAPTGNARTFLRAELIRTGRGELRA